MHVFVYGSLMAPEVMDLVTGLACRPPVTACLTGFTRAMLRDRRYPGIRPVADVTTAVTGLLFSGLTEQAMSRLDHFESDIYQRQQQTVRVGEEKHEAWCYVLSPDFNHLFTTEPWDLDWFRETHLEQYLVDAERHMASWES